MVYKAFGSHFDLLMPASMLSTALQMSSGSPPQRQHTPFVGTTRSGETTANLSTLTSTCQCHEINPHTHLTQRLTGLPETQMSQLYQWQPDQ